MKKLIRWGVIGSGGIARRRTIPEGLVPSRNAVLKAVYDVQSTVNDEVAAQTGAHPAGSIEELLDRDIDAVYIATPAHAHAAQAAACRRAGKHVLCEKPLGLSATQVRRMSDSFKEAGLLLAPAFMMRFQAQHRQALDWIRKGRLGTPVFARAQLSCWDPPIPGAWRQDPALGGGGALMDLGGHCIDLLEMYFGRARAVQCAAGNLVHAYASEDTAVVLLEFESGAKGVVDCLFNVPDAASRNRLELYGSLGGILAEGTIGQGEAGTMTAHLEDGAGEYAAQQERGMDGGFSIAPKPVNMYRAEVEAFSQAVLDGTPPPVSGDDGCWSQKVLAACYESARTGTRVVVG